MHVRKKAVYFLGENSRNAQTVAFLLKIAKTDPSFEVREHAVYALAEVPEGRGTSALMDIVQSSKETEIRKKAVYWLGDKAKSVEIIQFIENVALEDTNEEVAAYAVYALAEAPKGKGNTSLMKIAKKHKNPHLRKKAVYWLGDQAHSEREVTFLENLLKNESDFEVQENILQALAEARKNQGIPALIKIAKFHENKSLRKKAIFWLGESNDPRAKQALLDIIETLH